MGIGTPPPIAVASSAAIDGSERLRRPRALSLNAYIAMLTGSTARPDKPAFDAEKAVSAIVLPEATVEVASLAAQSSRSLFLFGPPGNGKTTLGRLLHTVQSGELWIPYCFCIESSIVRVYDRQIHKSVDDVELLDDDKETPAFTAFDTNKVDSR